MKLVKNDAAAQAAADEGLKSTPDSSHVKAALDVAQKGWKEAKDLLDGMDADELEGFIGALEGIPLQKTGTVQLRVSPRDYARLRHSALKSKMTVTDVLMSSNIDLT